MTHHDWVISTIKNNGFRTFAEIGVWNGDLAERVIRETGIFYIGVEARVNRNLMDKVADRCLNGWGLGLFSAHSVHASQYIADWSLDMVYIDADHFYESVKSDIICWFPKVRRKGIIAGHDYTKHGGARNGGDVYDGWMAVDEFFNNVRLEHDDEEGCDIWWTVKDENALRMG